MAILLIFTVSVGLSFSDLVIDQPEIYYGITYDLTILAPLLYFFIVRKSSIPNITVVPVFITGYIIASFCIPSHANDHLKLIEMIILPAVELTVITFIVIKVRKSIKLIRINRKNDPDLYSVIKKSTSLVLKSELAGKIVATEIAMIYFGLFRWTKTRAADNQFTSYKETGVIAIYYTLIFLVIAETIGLHILLIKWHEITAWVIFGLSIYAGLQLLGHARALTSRFIEITNDSLILRYGLYADVKIPLSSIMIVEQYSTEVIEKDIKQIKLLGALESHNVRIELNNKVQVESVYGTGKSFSKFVLYVDQVEHFLQRLKQSLDELK